MKMVKPLVVGDFYVKSDKKPPEEPQGYKTGARWRDEILRDNPNIDSTDIRSIRQLASEKDDDFFAWTDQSDYSEPGEDVFFLSGLYGLKKPELAIGRRRKSVPWNKRSMNYADENKREYGVSVINIVTEENQFESTHYDAFNSDTKNIWVWGYLPDQDIFYGSDGEPVLVNAAELGPANTSQIKSATNNNGSFDGSNPDIAYSKAQTHTPEFKSWFGDSSVVDENGDPLVVYHGTGAAFTEFTYDHAGSVTEASSAAKAFFFTPDKATADAYATYAAEDGPVKNVMRKADAAEADNDWDEYDRLLQIAEDMDSSDGRATLRENAQVMGVYLSGDFLEVDAEGKTPQELSEDNDVDSWLSDQLDRAKRLGKDGVHFKNLDDAIGLYNHPADHYAAFNPTQIKSATGNNGSFDGSNPDINYSKARETGSIERSRPSIRTTSILS